MQNKKRTSLKHNIVLLITTQDELNQLAERGIPIIDVLAKQFNVTKQDPLTEYTYGDGAIHLTDCRMIVKDGGYVYAGEQEEPEDKGKWINRIALYGIAINTPNMVNKDKKLQMWDCDVIIIPRKKYRDGFNKNRADQKYAITIAGLSLSTTIGCKQQST